MIVAALPAELCAAHISESAQFCLDVAFSQDTPSEIWIIGGSGAPNPQLVREYHNTPVKRVNLDPKVWPLDIGPNQILEPPLIVKHAVFSRNPDAAVSKIYLPLHSASGYFLEMARSGGLTPSKLDIVTTCFLPKSFEIPASLILPTSLKDVVTCELETQCARMSKDLWVTSETVIPAVRKSFSLSSDSRVRVFSRDKSKAAPSKPAREISHRHIIFSGPLSPVYGADAFSDLAELLDSQNRLDHITVITPGETTEWSRNIKSRLSALKTPVKFHQTLDLSSPELETLGILIAPMRAPVMTKTVSDAINHHMPCIVGQGFDLALPQTQIDTLYYSVSDVRKLTEAFDKIVSQSTHPQTSVNQTHLPAPKLIPEKALETDSKRTERSSIETVSVILLHHDRISELSQALHSLKTQTLQDFEIIVVDDGSSSVSYNDIKSVLDSFEFKNAHLSQIENSYPGAARNHGVLTATGDAVFFLDDDNVLDPKTLECFLKAIQTQDIVLSFYQTFHGDTPPEISETETSRPCQTGLCYSFAGPLPGAGLFYNIIGNSSFMMRRDRFLSAGGFSSKYGVGLEDYSFMLTLSQISDLQWVILPEPYLHFRLHSEKIRNTHVDWRSPFPLQSGQWRLIQDLSQNGASLSPASLAYARQLHEITQYHHIQQPRPKYFRLKSVLMHHYFRPAISRQKTIRRLYRRFMGGESRIAKWIEKLL